MVAGTGKQPSPHRNYDVVSIVSPKMPLIRSLEATSTIVLSFPLLDAFILISNIKA